MPGEGEDPGSPLWKTMEGEDQGTERLSFLFGGDFKRTLGIIVGGFWRPQGLLGPSMSYYFGRLIPPRIFIQQKAKLF